MLHACILLLIVVFARLATLAPSKSHSLFFILWSNSSAVSIGRISSTRRLTVFGVSLSCYRSSRSSRVAYKASPTIPTILAVILRGSAIRVVKTGGIMSKTRI